MIYLKNLKHRKKQKYKNSKLYAYYTIHQKMTKICTYLAARHDYCNNSPAVKMIEDSKRTELNILLQPFK